MSATDGSDGVAVAAGPVDGLFAEVVGQPRAVARMAAAVVNDFTVQGASSTQVNSRKIAHMKRVATQRRMPLVLPPLCGRAHTAGMLHTGLLEQANSFI